MLMDEPFGAIDPINRERLQNEFLRLQAELRKTIVFVTHDIDEAIKMGDRIAILQEGGEARAVRAAGRAAHGPGRPTSSRTSSAPTARSSAWRCSACATSTCGRRRSCAPASRSPRRAPGAPTADLRHRAARRRRRPPAGLAVGARPAAASASARDLRSRADPVVELDDILRDALADLLHGRDAVRAGRRRPRRASRACCRSRSLSHALTSPEPDELRQPTRRELRRRAS